MKRKWKHEMRGIKSRAEKFYVPTTLQKTEKKLNGREQKKRDTFFNSQFTRQLSWAIWNEPFEMKWAITEMAS